MAGNQIVSDVRMAEAQGYQELGRATGEAVVKTGTGALEMYGEQQLPYIDPRVTVAPLAGSLTKSGEFIEGIHDVVSPFETHQMVESVAESGAVIGLSPEKIRGGAIIFELFAEFYPPIAQWIGGSLMGIVENYDDDYYKNWNE